MMTFAEFVASDHYARWKVDGDAGAEFRARLAKADIRSFRELVEWVSERYPDVLRSYPKHSKRRLADIWADYLRLVEVAE